MPLTSYAEPPRKITILNIVPGIPHTPDSTGLKLHTQRLHRLEWLALLVIVVIAALLRLGAPGTVEFKRDEANLSFLSLDLARGLTHTHLFPLLGIDSSVGIPNAPVNVYLMALPYLVSSDPMLATQFVGLLNVIAVGLVFFLARRYYGPIAAIVAGLLYAASPWAVIFSRKVWAQDMLPMFVLLTIGTGLLGFLEAKRWAQWLHLPLLAITGQIHYGAFVLLPITLYLVFIGRRRLTRAFLFSLPLTLVVVAPYVYGAARASLLNPAVLQKVIAPGDKPHAITLSGEAIQDTIFMIAGTDIHSLAGASAYQQYLDSVPNAYPVFNVLLIAVGLATLWLIVGPQRPKGRLPIDMTVLIWLLFTPLVYSITWTPVFPHYLIPMLPAAFLVLGAASADLWRLWRENRSLHLAVFGIGGTALAVIAALQVWLQLALLGFLSVHPTPGGFGTPLSYYEPIRHAVLAAHPQEVIANLDGQYIGYHDEATVWNLLLYDIHSVRFVDATTDVYPAQPVLSLSHHCTDPAATQTFDLRTHDEGCFAIRPRTPADFDQTAYAAIPDAGKSSFDNGAQMLAYQWQTQPTACLKLVWTVNQPRARDVNRDFNFAAHFINADGQETLQADALSWRSRYWRTGDTIIRTLCLQGDQTQDQAKVNAIVGVRIGMYTYQDTPQGRTFDNVNLLDANGTPIGQSQEIRFAK